MRDRDRGTHVGHTHTHVQPGSQAGRDRQTVTQADRQTDKYTGGQTDRERQTDRQTDRHRQKKE